MRFVSNGGESGERMNFMKRDIISCGQLVVVLAGVFFVTAEVVAEEHDMMSVHEQKEIVNTVCSFLENNYVFPDIGEKTGKKVLENYENGKYLQYASAREFARELSADLEELSQDKHLKVVYDPDWVTGLKEQGTEGDAYLTKEMIEEERRKNFGFKEIRILDGNIGYVDLRMFYHPKYGGETAVAAMSFVSSCDALIIDVRNNGGGWGYMVAFLCSYFFDNEDPIQFSSAYSRPEDKTYQSWSLPYLPGKIMSDIPLYILTSKSTFSAAEEFCYNLKHADRATIIGETTRGGAHPIDVKVLSDALVLIMPEWRSIHPKTNTDWEGIGVQPDIEVAAEEALYVAHVQALETLLARAPDEETKHRCQWYIDGIKAKRNPSSVDVSRMRLYTGTYGSYSIMSENGVLYCAVGNRAKHRMVSMNKDLFLIEDIGDRRLYFMIENDDVRGVAVMYEDGTRTVFTKEDVQGD